MHSLVAVALLSETDSKTWKRLEKMAPVVVDRAVVVAVAAVVVDAMLGLGPARALHGPLGDHHRVLPRAKVRDSRAMVKARGRAMVQGQGRGRGRVRVGYPHEAVGVGVGEAGVAVVVAARASQARATDIPPSRQHDCTCCYYPDQLSSVILDPYYKLFVILASKRTRKLN